MGRQTPMDWEAADRIAEAAARAPESDTAVSGFDDWVLAAAAGNDPHDDDDAWDDE
ncbi:hypothetical protein [Streptomyces spectabilis]|uniref:hypothetical protein n=1 Tax=Streptomyces spectabilis TaxID=68270 RepID=UPI001376D0E8|nr:hypothetical protein [Streptomyces spectabilis]